MQSTAATNQQVPYWRLSSFYFFYFGLLGAMLPFWPLYLRELGYSADKIGYITGAVMATKIIAPNIWGYLADVSGRRMRIIRMGSLLAFVSFFAILLRQDFWWMMLVVVAYSFFWNAVLAQFEVATLSHLKGRYERYSLIRVWGSVGFVVAVATLGLVFDYISVSWLPYFLLSLLGGIWISSLLVSEPSGGQHEQHERPSLMSVLRAPSVISFFVICFLLQVSHGPYYTFFSVYLENHGFNRTATGMLWSLGVFAEVLLFLVMHHLLRWYSLYSIMVVSLLLSLVRWLMIAYLVESPTALIIAQLLHAASFGSFHAFAVEMVRKLFPGKLQGQGMALYSALSFGAGGAIGAVGSGWLWDVNPVLTFVIAAGTCLLAVLIAFLVNPCERLGRHTGAGQRRVVPKD